jgi:hypothetical protein
MIKKAFYNDAMSRTQAFELYSCFKGIRAVVENFGCQLVHHHVRPMKTWRKCSKPSVRTDGVQ